MSDDLIGLLAESKLFVRFSPEQLEEVILHMNPRAVKLKSGDRVYKKGDAADRCWLIQSGKLMLKRSSLRSPFRHMIYNKGSVTGIQGLVVPGTTREVSMIADGKVRLIEITHEGVEHLNTDTKILFWENVSKILMRKLTVCLSQEHLSND
jgi:CRP-like cAMP-binding protein